MRSILMLGLVFLFVVPVMAATPIMLYPTGIAGTDYNTLWNAFNGPSNVPGTIFVLSATSESGAYTAWNLTSTEAGQLLTIGKNTAIQGQIVGNHSFAYNGGSVTADRTVIYNSFMGFYTYTRADGNPPPKFEAFYAPGNPITLSIQKLWFERSIYSAVSVLNSNGFTFCDNIIRDTLAMNSASHPAYGQAACVFLQPLAGQIPGAAKVSGEIIIENNKIYLTSLEDPYVKYKSGITVDSLQNAVATISGNTIESIFYGAAIESLLHNNSSVTISNNNIKIEPQIGEHIFGAPTYGINSSNSDSTVFEVSSNSIQIIDKGGYGSTSIATGKNNKSSTRVLNNSISLKSSLANAKGISCVFGGDNDANIVAQGNAISIDSTPSPNLYVSHVGIITFQVFGCAFDQNIISGKCDYGIIVSNGPSAAAGSSTYFTRNNLLGLSSEIAPVYISDYSSKNEFTGNILGQAGQLPLDQGLCRAAIICEGQSNKFVDNDYTQSGIKGLSASEICLLLTSTSQGNHIAESKFPSGTTLCDQVLDLPRDTGQGHSGATSDSILGYNLCTRDPAMLQKFEAAHAKLRERISQSITKQAEKLINSL